MPGKSSNTNRPAVVVHHVDDVRAVLTVAADAGVPVALLSPPGFAGYAGPAYFQEMCAAAREAVPNADFIAILDCGDATGHVLATLRAGIDHIVFSGSRKKFDRLASLAEKQGARILRRPRRALDLGAPEVSTVSLAAWLRGASK